MGVPPAPPAPPGAISDGHSTIMELDRAVEQEKSALVQKLRSQIQDSAAKAKWTSFCQVHGQGKTDVNHHDMAFSTTFLEAYEMGTIITLDDHETDAADAGEGGASSNKIFVGGLPQGTTEDKLWRFFGQWGRVEKVDCKKDENGHPRGFAFVTFQNQAHAQQVVENKDGNKLDGKWIDCKIAESSNKCGGKDKRGKDAGKGGKDACKGGKDAGKGGDKGEGKGAKDSGKDSLSGAGGSDWKSGNDWKSSNSGKWESKDDQGGRGSWSNSGGGGDKWGGSDKHEAGNDGSWGRGGGVEDKNAGGSGGSWSGGGGGGGSGDSAAKGGAGASSGANWNQNGNGRDAGYGAAEGGDAGSRWGPY